MEDLLEQILDQLIMINQKLNLNTAESLPDLITIDHIRKYFNIGKNKAYEILLMVFLTGCYQLQCQFYNGLLLLVYLY